jgi:hypothetical protein
MQNNRIRLAEEYLFEARSRFFCGIIKDYQADLLRRYTTSCASILHVRNVLGATTVDAHGHSSSLAADK